jgi:hypothetical protein
VEESHAIMPGMVRVPNTESPELEAKRFLESFDRQVADIQRRRVYRWTTDQDEISHNCIMVGIGGTSTDMLAGGLTYVEPMASIYWCAQVTANGVYEAGSEMGPFPVLDALRRADALVELMGYTGVAIMLNEAGIWRPEWGTLADQEGL